MVVEDFVNKLFKNTVVMKEHTNTLSNTFSPPHTNTTKNHTNNNV